MEFPDEFILEKSLLKNVFIDESIQLGCSLADTNTLFQGLPVRIRDANVEKYKMGSPEWRYIYGEEFNIGNRHGIGVPFQRPLVSSLIRAYLIAKKYLHKFQYNEWSKRVGSPAKHFGAIAEMLVVTNIKSENVLTYEKRHSGINEKSIDWLLETKDGSFLLEVKGRLGQIAQHLEQEQELKRTSSLLSEPIPNIEKLFVDTITKFKTVSETINIQGVALFLSIKVPKVPFENYFLKHAQEKLHFVALVKEEGTHVNLIAVSDEVKARVLSAFGWIDDADFFLETA